MSSDREKESWRLRREAKQLLFVDSREQIAAMTLAAQIETNMLLKDVLETLESIEKAR